jgi:hypothetical protein
MKSRHAIGVTVLAIWLGMVGWHVRREYWRPEAERLAAGARMLAPGAHWYVVRMGDVPIGIAQSRLDTLPGGYAFNDEMTMDVPALGASHRAQARTRIELGPALELLGFEFGLDSEIGRFQVSARAEGDSALAVTMNAGSGPQRSRMRVSKGCCSMRRCRCAWPRPVRCARATSSRRASSTRHRCRSATSW